jgi:hypothetical protein
MYLYQTITGADAVEFCKNKLELPPDFDLSVVSRVEIFSANTTDGGEDY